MAYTVIARRYRSQTFDDVVGQDAVAQTLKNAIQMGRVAHAYLLCGTRGVGKTTMARILAKSLNCLEADGPTVNPCLKCDSCVAVNQGDDIDVIEIDGASNTGVDNIRQLRENAIYRPARARFKIYIIDEVHMLSTGAFNALLKILEEPPEHVKFIFATTEPNKVLATIQSRCQRFDFQNISAEIIGQQLEKILKDEKIEYESDLVIYLSRLANGSMRDALSLLDQCISAGVQPLTAAQLNELVGVPDKQKVLQLLAGMAASNGPDVLNAIDELIDTGQSAAQICDLLIENLRDLMVFRCAGPDSKVLVLTADEKQQISAAAAGFDVPALIYNITALEKLRWTLKNSETSRPLLEALLLRLTLSEHFMSLANLSTQVGSAPATAAGIKKNDIASPTAAAAPVSASIPAAPAVQADIQSIQSAWPMLVNTFNGREGGLVPFLTKARPVSLNNNTLEIQFDTGGAGTVAKSMCDKKADVIANILSGAAGVQLSVRFSQGDAPSTEDQSKDPKPKPKPKPEDIRIERSKILADPAVQMVLNGLNATPSDIQKIEIEIEDETEEEQELE